MTKVQYLKVFMVSLGVLACFGNIAAIVSLFLMVIGVYTVLSCVYNLPLSKVIRKIVYRYFARDMFIEVAEGSHPFLAYALVMRLQLDPNYEKQYINLGHDKFIEWLVTDLGKITDGIVDAMAGKKRDYEYSSDPETEKLMKEAMSEEYRDIPFREQFRKYTGFVRKRKMEKALSKSAEDVEAIEDENDESTSRFSKKTENLQLGPATTNTETSE